MEDKFNEFEQHNNCDCHHHSEENCHCGGHDEYHECREPHAPSKLKYKDFQFDDNADYSCDLDPSKICDNCGKCLDIYNTDKEGFVQIQIDKIDKGDSSLSDLYKMYGLDED